jgi:hypothetical protein
VVNWDTGVSSNQDKAPGADLPLWHMALFMPAAKQMGCLASLVNSIDFWRLRPEPKVVVGQPGDPNPRRQATAAATEAKDLVVVYVPEGGKLELNLEALPRSPVAAWMNPRTGEDAAAPASLTERLCVFATPDSSDWVLVVRAGK